MSRSTSAELTKVLKRDNCSGCGACAALIPSIRMVLSSDGYLRPALPPALSQTEDALGEEFRQVCPGVQIVAEPPDGSGPSKVHPIFGRVVEAWQGFSSDPSDRYRGSSGGVLTTLNRWMLEEGVVSQVTLARPDPGAPERTIAITTDDPSEVRRGAGSRYSPVAIASLPKATHSGGAVVGKPCEISALRSRSRVDGSPAPILLSFFCAGTPSQNATTRLVEELGFEVEGVSELSYRGDGWPGNFRVIGTNGSSGELTYEDSWGRHLGRELQWRCKICPDGTGNDADISVGDFWDVDPRGYPVFRDAPGNSVIIARTERGRALVERAAAAGILNIESVSLAAAAEVQPLQVQRKQTLAGRLMARLAVGRPGPMYRGHSILLLLGANKRANVRAALGSLRRVILRRQTRQDW